MNLGSDFSQSKSGREENNMLTSSTGKYTPELRPSNQIKLNVPVQKHIISSSKNTHESELTQENPLYQKSKQLVLNQNRKNPSKGRRNQSE